MRLTITEALAEIKTAMARISKKQEAIMRYFSRDSALRDPLEKDVEGGSQAFVRNERQSIRDLQNRIVRIRSAIQKVNLETDLVINNSTKSVSAWLNWRREISNVEKGFLNQMAQSLNSVRTNAMRQGRTITDKADNYAPGDVVVMVNEQELAKDIEGVETTLGLLDGKLSLLNATTTIEVD